MNITLNIDDKDIPRCLIPLLQHEMEKMVASYIGSKISATIMEDIDRDAKTLADMYRRPPRLDEFEYGTRKFLEQLGVFTRRSRLRKPNVI